MGDDVAKLGAYAAAMAQLVESRATLGYNKHMGEWYVSIYPNGGGESVHAHDPDPCAAMARAYSRWCELGKPALRPYTDEEIAAIDAEIEASTLRQAEEIRTRTQEGAGL